jgi:hypothetical protein
MLIKHHTPNTMTLADEHPLGEAVKEVDGIGNRKKVDNSDF